MTIPVWSIGLMVTLGMGFLAFAWGLALKAERSADRLESAVAKLQALEARIAVIAALETVTAVLRADVTHLQAHATATGEEIDGLRARQHELAGELQRVSFAAGRAMGVGPG